MPKKKDREFLAKICFCRAILNVHGFLTESENEKVFQRIRKYQDKHKIEISEAQLYSVDMTYDDNAKGE